MPEGKAINFYEGIGWKVVDRDKISYTGNTMPTFYLHFLFLISGRVFFVIPSCNHLTFWLLCWSILPAFLLMSPTALIKCISTWHWLSGCTINIRYRLKHMHIIILLFCISEHILLEIRAFGNTVVHQVGGRRGPSSERKLHWNSTSLPF